VPSESDLRDLLRGSEPEGRAAIDLDAVLTRARRRRRPRVIAAQVLGSVAVVGALFTAVVAVQPPQQTATMIAEDAGAGGSDADTAPFVDDSALKVADQCGLAPVVTGPAPWSLDLTNTTADGVGALARVILTLPGGGPWAEATATLESLTVARGGVVVATALPTDVTGPVADPSGEGVSWDARFAVESCDGEPLTSGAYEMRAVVVVSVDGTSPATETIHGTPVVVEIK
jgi:hypothetical protein